MVWRVVDAGGVGQDEGGGTLTRGEDDEVGQRAVGEAVAPTDEADGVSCGVCELAARGLDVTVDGRQ